MALKPIPQPLLRIVVLRDRTNCDVAAGIGRPWLAYCPCCARRPGYGFFASFGQWRYAISWAVRHANTAHTCSHPSVAVSSLSCQEAPC